MQLVAPVADLRPVEFLDCYALGLLCRARRRALEHHGRLSLKKAGVADQAAVAAAARFAPAGADNSSSPPLRSLHMLPGAQCRTLLCRGLCVLRGPSEGVWRA
ncbi:hypothetical protein GCM10009837_67640 [Streptomyces durmitorensis]